MAITHKIAPCFWFDHQGEEAANFYVSIFRNSKIVAVTRYAKAGQEIHGRPPGSVMTVAFELEGQPFTALNGGPAFTFNEAVSLQVLCANQEEIDHYWNTLTEGGDPKAQACGWLKDKYGVSWQVVPASLPQMLKDAESPKAERLTEAILRMKKLDIRELERAAEGELIA